MKIILPLEQNLSAEDAVEVDADDAYCGPGYSVCAACRKKISNGTCFWIVYHGLTEPIDAHCCDVVCLKKFLKGVGFLCFNWN